MTRPAVLMVTGAYYPDVSGAGLQCRALVRALRDRVAFTVLTTSRESPLPPRETVDGVPVYRVRVRVNRLGSRLASALSLTRAFVRVRRSFDIVHLHGFSRKTFLLVVLARLFGKKLVLKLTSVGHDDPLSVRARGRVGFWFYSRADLFCGVSARLEELYLSSGLPRERFRLIPNGVDVERFRPGDADERRALRAEMGFPEDLPLILFVGHFSREKHPEALFDAWRSVCGDEGSASQVVFVGATRPGHYEVDPELVRRIRDEARRLGMEKHVAFVEATEAIEKYYRAADVFVLPSGREGLPNALLEAMASGLPCAVSRLEGVTDVVIDHGVNGLLVPLGDAPALADTLRLLLRDVRLASELGRRARETVVARYPLAQTADAYLEAYRLPMDRRKEAHEVPAP